MEELKKLFCLIKENAHVGAKSVPEENILLQKVAPDLCELMWNLICYMERYCLKTLEKISHIRTKLVKVDMLKMYSPVIFDIIDCLMEFEAVPEIKEYIKNNEFYKKYEFQSFSYEKLFRSVCESIVKDMEKITSGSKRYFWVQADPCDAYGGIMESNADNFDLDEPVRLTILSDELLAYDDFAFSVMSNQGGDGQLREIIRESYRPYFIEYFFDAGQLSEELKKLLFGEGMQGNWYPACFVSEGGEVPGDAELLEGLCVYSGNQDVALGKNLLLFKTVADGAELKRIEKTYELPRDYCADIETITPKLGALFHNFNFDMARIYKVGNGNCIYLGESDRTIKDGLLYDVGLDLGTIFRHKRKEENFPYQSAVDEIRELAPCCVLLSHWHADHFYSYYDNQKLDNCQWVAPDLTDAGINAKRLGKFLLIKDTILFVDTGTASRELHVCLPQSGELTLYVGAETNSVPKIQKINQKGIALKYEGGSDNGGKITCMMQGDVPYDSLPPCTYQTGYNYLVVPHHGSKMDCGKLPGSQTSAGDAVICCNHGKNRPASEHDSALRKYYREVVITEDAHCYIQLDLQRGHTVIKR